MLLYLGYLGNPDDLATLSESMQISKFIEYAKDIGKLSENYEIFIDNQTGNDSKIPRSL